MRFITNTRSPLSALALAALIAASLASCKTAKSIGSTAAKPFKAAGEVVSNTAKKANPMRLFNRNKDEVDPSAEVNSELAEVTPDPANPAPPAPPLPTQNTATPGAQTTASNSRSTLSLPSRPTYTPPALPQQPSPPPTIAQQPEPRPTSPPSGVSDFDQPLRLDVPPINPGAAIPPLSAPPTIIDEDDGFIQLTPKLPGEEDILPPQ